MVDVSGDESWDPGIPMRRTMKVGDEDGREINKSLFRKDNKKKFNTCRIHVVDSSCLGLVPAIFVSLFLLLLVSSASFAPTEDLTTIKTLITLDQDASSVTDDPEFPVIDANNRKDDGLFDADEVSESFSSSSLSESSSPPPLQSSSLPSSSIPSSSSEEELSSSPQPTPIDRQDKDRKDGEDAITSHHGNRSPHLVHENETDDDDGDDDTNDLTTSTLTASSIDSSSDEPAVINPSHPTSNNVSHDDNNHSQGHKYDAHHLHDMIRLVSFTRSSYNVSISELATGKTYATLAVDPSIPPDEVSAISREDPTFIYSPYIRMGVFLVKDDAPFYVRYKIVSGDDRKLFKIDCKRVGNFAFLLLRSRSTTEVSLNREYQDYYHLKVRATVYTHKTSSSSPGSSNSNYIRVKLRTDLHVKVEDANDLSPIFYPDRYDTKIPSDTPPDTRVTVVTAFDSDVGLNGEIYYYFDPSSSSPGILEDFAIHPTKGYISTLRPLEPSRTRELVILASDRERRGGSSLAVQSRATVRVTVTQASSLSRYHHHHHLPPLPSTSSLYLENETEDDVFEYDKKSSSSGKKSSSSTKKKKINEDDPSSSKIVFHFSVPENSKSGTILVYESSITTDDDYEDDEIGINFFDKSSMTLKYRLTDPTNTFSIDQRTGILTVKNGDFLDREVKSFYKLHVSVTDVSVNPPASSSAIVMVTVSDVNDNPPKFHNKIYYVKVREDLPVTTIVTRVRAIDEDEDGNQLGHVKYTIDKTGGKGSQATYRSSSFLVGHDESTDDSFKVDEVTGVVRINRPLDFERKPVYNLTVIASDGLLSSAAHLLIEVEDVDDNQSPPRITTTNPSSNCPNCESIVLMGRVGVDSPPGTHVMTVKADSDDDEDKFLSPSSTEDNHHHLNIIPSHPSTINHANRISYHLVGGNGLSYFSLDEESGEVFLDRRLPRTGSSFWLTLVVRDKSPIPKSTHVHVFIQVDEPDDNGLFSSTPTSPSSNNLSLLAEDNSTILVLDEGIDKDVDSATSNDRHPKFVSESFHFVIPENSLVGSAVGQVVCDQQDVTYTIMYGNVDSTFTIDSLRGVIILNKELDVRLQAEYHLAVKAVTSGGVYSFTSVELMVVVPDHVPPKFDKRVYTIPVSESTAVNKIIFGGQVGQVGGHIYSKQLLTYELIASTSNIHLEYFTIDCYSGEVQLIRKLDYERIKMHEVMIRATNLVGLSANASLLINVLDANDNQPKWNETNYLGYISEDSAIGSIVLEQFMGSKSASKGRPLTLVAYDEDSGLNSRLNFSIREPLARKYFSIEEGVIHLKKEVSYEKTPSINFTVRLADSGLPESQEADDVAHVTILVTIPDPEFEALSVKIDLKEDTPVGSVLFDGIKTMTKSTLSYDLSAFGDDRDFLEINNMTGQVVLSKPLDYEVKKEIKFVVTARNLIGSRATSSFLVNVLDVNDCPPEFTQREFVGYISEDAEPGSYILTRSNETLFVTATDGDSPFSNNSRLEYFIKSFTDVFHVHPTDGVISIKHKLAYATQHQYVIVVSVKDSGQPELTAAQPTLVIVHVNKTTRPDPTTTTSTLPPDPCVPNPCLNFGSCQTSTSGDFNCSCQIGYSGRFCEVSSFMCTASRPCRNAGICQETDTQSRCECRPGFEGDLCEEDIDECALSDSLICPPPATCINLPGTYRCVCSPLLVNGSSHSCTNYYPSRIGFASTDYFITLEVAYGVLCVLFIVILTCCCCTCCRFYCKSSRKHPPSRNRTPPQAYATASSPENNDLIGPKFNSSPVNDINVKRFSNATNSRPDGHPESGNHLSSSMTLLNHGHRPLSLNNFDNIRVVGLVAEEGEIYSLSATSDIVLQRTAAALTLGSSQVGGNMSGHHHHEFCSSDQREMYQRCDLLSNLKKSSKPPIVTVTPQVTNGGTSSSCDARCSSHSLRGLPKIQNDGMKPSSASSSVRSNCKRSRPSICDSELNVFQEDSSTNASSNAEAYHWDCSDWQLLNDSHNGHHPGSTTSNKNSTAGGPSTMHEVSLDSASNSDNSRTDSQGELTGDDVRRLSDRLTNHRRKGFVGSSETSLTTEVPTSSSRVHPPLPPKLTMMSNGSVKEEDEEEELDNDVQEMTGLLNSLEDIEFADRSPSEKYMTIHPNTYLPIYQPVNGRDSTDLTIEVNGGSSSTNSSMTITTASPPIPSKGSNDLRPTTSQESTYV